MRKIKAPDFPTAGLIIGREGIKDAYETGRGSIKMRARVQIEEGHHGRARLVVTELPYMVNKARLAEKIAQLYKTGKVKDIADLKDESSGRGGMRLVVDLRRGANPHVVLNQLIHHYIEHQVEVVTRRSRYELRKAEERDHIVQGLLIALEHIDEVIRIIRASSDSDEARTKLMSKFKLSEIQANYILDMPLRRLTRLERTKLEDEHKELLSTIRRLKALLKDPQAIRDRK